MEPDAVSPSTINNINASTAAPRLTSASSAAVTTATVKVTSTKQGNSGQNRLLAYAPSNGPAIRSVSSGPNTAYPTRNTSRQRCAAAGLRRGGAQRCTGTGKETAELLGLTARQLRTREQLLRRALDYFGLDFLVGPDYLGRPPRARQHQRRSTTVFGRYGPRDRRRTRSADLTALGATPPVGD